MIVGNILTHLSFTTPCHVGELRTLPVRVTTLWTEHWYDVDDGRIHQHLSHPLLVGKVSVVTSWLG